MNLSTIFSTVLSTATQFWNNNTSPAANNADKPFAFSFGDPEPVLNRNDWSWLNSGYSVNGMLYIPPINYVGLANMMDANPYHGPIIHKKKDLLLQWLNPSPICPQTNKPYFSMSDMERLILDFLVTGNLYPQRFFNGFGNFVRMGHKPALYTFRGIDLSGENKEFYIEEKPLYDNSLVNTASNIVTYAPGEVLQLQTHDTRQSIYGMPTYLGGVQNVLLSEASTLFRRKYYLNGAHLGYILVANDANFDENTAKEIEDAIKQGKGAGAFRSMFLNIPRSQSREPIKVIPIGNFGTQDEYQAISEVSEMAMCAMHQIPPSVASIIPANTGGFGKPSEALEYYYWTGILPMQNKLLQINELVGKQIISFKKPDFLTPVTN